MIDFTKGDSSKSHKNSFEKTIKSLIEHLSDLESKYLNDWGKLENKRKERAAIIEELIKFIKDSKIKIKTPLGRCNNQQVIEQLEEVMPSFSKKDQDYLNKCIKQLTELSETITEIGAKLEKYTNELSDIRLKEADYEDEVIFVPKKKRKQNITQEERAIIEEEDLLISPASIKKDTDISNIIAEEIEEILSSPVPANNNEQIEISTSSDEYVAYTLKNGITFVEIAKNVYGDEKLWEDLYRYETNKDIISRRASEFGVDVQTAVNSPKILENITLLLPTELTYIEKN